MYTINTIIETKKLRIFDAQTGIIPQKNRELFNSLRLKKMRTQESKGSQMNILGGKKKKSAVSELIGIVSVLFMAFLFSIQCSNNIWHRGNIKTDSSVFYYVARVILNGGMPYKDTFDHKGPLLYVLNVIGLRIASMKGIWVVELLFLAGTFYLFYRTARLLTGPLFSVLAVLSAGSLLYVYFDGGNYTEEYALLFIAGAQFIFTDYFLNDKITNLRLILCGACFGAVLMLRPNMVAIWVVMCIGVLFRCIREKTFGSLVRFLLFFLAGVILACAPLCFWLYKNGAFDSFIDCYLTFNTLYSSATRGTMQTAYRVRTFIHFLNDNVVLVTACAAVLVCVRFKRLNDILQVIFFFITLLLLSISAQSYSHYGIVLVPALIYPIAGIGSLIPKGQNNNALAIFVALFFLPTLILPNWLKMVDDAFYYYATNEYDHFYRCDIEAAKIVNTYSDPEDKILVCGNWDSLYNYTNRFSVSYYSYQNMPCSLDPARMEQFMKEVEEASPKVIALMDGCFVEKRIQEYMSANGYEEVFHGKYDDFSTTVYSKTSSTTQNNTP